MPGPKPTVIEADDIDDLDFDLPPDSKLSPLPPSRSNPALPSMTNPIFQRPVRTVDEATVKDWSCLYPIYVDGKRPNKKGERRVPMKCAVAWPLASHMAQIAGMMGFQVVLEPQKSHPRDWENPGRVRVLLKQNGKPMHPSIQDKYTLLCRIGTALRDSHPSAIPNKKSPLPPIEKRLPPNSPAISYGLLDESIKGGGMMKQMQEAMGMGMPGPIEGGGRGSPMGMPTGRTRRGKIR